MGLDWRGALVYPFSGPGRERPVLATWVLLLVGTVVPLVPFVPALGLLVPLLVLIVAVGYLVRVLVASERGEPAPRLLTAPTDLVRTGVGTLFVSAVYLFIPLILLVVTIHGALVTDRVPDPDSITMLRIYAGSTVVLVLSLLGAYLLPIALFRYGRTESLRAAFSRTWLRGAATHGAYFAGWTLGAVLATIGVSVATTLFSIDRIGPVLAALALAHAAIVTCHVWGRSLARVH